MSVQVWFAQDEVTVRPGESTSLSLAVENVSDRTESFTIMPAGLTAGWTTVTRPNITLFGGSRDVVEVVVHPPAIHSTTAGPTSLAVRVIPQNDPESAIVAENVVEVAPFDDRRVTVLQPLQRARRRATYEFMVENHGNNLANCRLYLVDASDRVDGAFDPPAVGVAPGSSNLVRLRVRANRAFFRRAERQLDFEIEATEPDHEPAAGRAALIQPPTVPLRSIGGLIAVVAAVVAIVVGWRSVVKPEIQDAADRAIEERLGEGAVDDEQSGATAPLGSVPAPADVTTTVPIAPAAPVGEPVAYRIAVDVGINQERSESVQVPGDSQFLLTDLVLQNPAGDLGTAQLLRNGNVLYEWDLGAMESANEFQPRVSPLPFAPNDNVVLSVACEAPVDPGGTGCAISVLMGGTLVPVDE